MIRKDGSDGRRAGTASTRDERLRAALRANLHRRKEQARDRAAADAATAGDLSGGDAARRNPAGPEAPSDGAEKNN